MQGYGDVEVGRTDPPVAAPKGEACLAKLEKPLPPPPPGMGGVTVEAPKPPPPPEPKPCGDAMVAPAVDTDGSEGERRGWREEEQVWERGIWGDGGKSKGEWWRTLMSEGVARVGRHRLARKPAACTKDTHGHI